MFSRIAIVGTGLLGASIGLAVRRAWPECRIVGIGRRQETLDSAKRLGAVDETSLKIAGGVAGCGLVVLCTPVGRIVEQVFEVAQAADSGPMREPCNPLLITDVGSTKQAICDAVEQRSPLPNGCRFLGGHPIAGGEKTGPESATAALFENRAGVLTPMDDAGGAMTSCDQAAVDTLRTFWETLGARVSCMSPQEHDRVLALTSHLPHVLSAVLATVCDRPTYSAYCGTGYASMTRLAAGGAELWRDILITNREAVCRAMDDFEKSCQKLRDALAQDDAEAVMQFLENARRNTLMS